MTSLALLAKTVGKVGALEGIFDEYSNGHLSHRAHQWAPWKNFDQTGIQENTRRPFMRRTNRV